LQGAALACWAYDLTTTFYAIDIAKIAYEVNPLGWPMGAVGALVYYAPTVALTYVLLFRIKDKIACYAAVPMTAVLLGMGAMNLNAGAGNFQFFIATASLPAASHFNLLALIAVADLACFALVASVAQRHILHGETRSLNKKLP
jgi:hypothetical protein